MHKSATKCNKTIGKWCKNKHGASKIIDTFETYHTFGGTASVPPPHSVSGALSTSSVMASLSGRPPLEPNTHVAHAPTLGAHNQTGATLSRFGDLRPMSLGSAGPAIDLNRTLSTGDTTLSGAKKPRRNSTASMPRAVNLFDDMPEQAGAPNEEVMTHPTCQLSLLVR
jgi:hypothetical protein